MCGIVGIHHYEDPTRSVDRALLTEMTRVLAHRGPDGEGVWTGPGIGLGHRRLAILDLTDRASQPMIDLSGRFVISYNGEIYNFRELRRDLKSKGHRFRSTGDTEVLLTAYKHWGRDVVTKISGIFAFGIWDSERRTLFLARDPMGVKPLFYQIGGGTFRFASEIKALLWDPAVAREPDAEALDAFFTFSYTPAPMTGFRQVRQLLPGHAATVTENGFSNWRYWDTPFAENPERIEFETACVEFTDHLDRLTRSQMVSDVGVGAFLSGGLDSAAVVRAMKRADLGPVKAFSIGFDWEAFDERARARATADQLGVEMVEQSVSADAASVVPELSRHLEEPTADSSALPVWFLCKGASEFHKVAMSGDGADEILAGYDTYRATSLAEHYRRLPPTLRRKILRRIAHALPVSDRKYSLHQRATRFTYGAELGPGLDHCAWRVIFTDDLKQRLYEPGFLERVANTDPMGSYAEHIMMVPEARERLAGLLNADTEFYLPNDMLVKVDRMSMAHGLEVRVPFLDVEMVRYCANLPADFKLHRGRTRKHILRESLRGSIPRKVIRAPKSGFNIPVERWMRGPLRDLLFDAVETVRHELGNILDLGELHRVVEEHERLRADHGHALFTVLMFALWLDNVSRSWKGSTPGSARVDSDERKRSQAGR